MRASVLTLLLLSLLTFIVGLGRPAIADGDEGYYAEAAREMVESGDWLTPHFNYTDRWQKPVLYYWAAAATFWAAGVSEWGARGFAASSGVALTLLTYAIGRRLLERSDAAWLGAAIVATCYGYFVLARLALPDLPLALFTTLAIFLWLEHRSALAGLAVAAGFLDKGPLAVVIPALVLVPIAWLDSRRRTVDADSTPISLRPKDIGTAALVFVVVATPWYAAMVAEHGTAYLQSFFIGDNLERFATDRFNAPRALWFYVPIVVGGIFPWTAYLLCLPWRRLRGLFAGRASLSTNEWRLLIWTAAPLLFFTASIGKQPRYILPVLPPLALLVGSAIARRIADLTDRPQQTSPRALTIATWLTGVIYLVLAALLFRAQPILINAHPVLTVLGIATLVTAGLTLGWTALTRRWSALPMRMTVTAVAVLMTVQFGALSGARPEPVEIVAQLVRANRGAGEPIATYHTLTRNLLFYTGVMQQELFDDQQALDFLNKDERVLLVARAEDVARWQAASGLPIKALGSVHYVDPGTLRLSTLLDPQPQQDVDDVLLVTNR